MRELVEDFTEHFLEKNPAALKLKNILGPQERRHLHQSNPQFHFEVQKKKTCLLCAILQYVFNAISLYPPLNRVAADGGILH